MSCGASLASIGNKLVDDLQESFAEHGEAAIARVRTERPCDYLRIIAAMAPKQVELSGGPFDAVLDGDLADLISSLALALDTSSPR